MFIMILPAAGTLVIASLARAQAAGMVSEKDAQAVALGFVSDASKADKARYKQYAPGQQCGSCVLFQGAAGAADGACPIFGGKHVPARGWCSAYVKKP
jgi:hypothetical protein